MTARRNGDRRSGGGGGRVARGADRRSGKAIFRELSKLVTEQRNPRSRRLDRLSTAQTLRLMNAEDRRVPLAVGREIPKIARAVDLMVDRLERGGRIFYVGAGTSGRLGVLDASERGRDGVITTG